ncbi:hypothetical protein F8388_023449 [Cannabis sativa]|uniref:Uncharacterized protein n=1 Tax=Cannabis sativa TaxID=3483 RepID=A0A7J6FN53_CANSA|nr:hypothetical protein F8388_023449 [Cannabis sativa]
MQAADVRLDSVTMMKRAENRIMEPLLGFSIYGKGLWHDFIIKMNVVPDVVFYGNVALSEVVTKKLLEVYLCVVGVMFLSSSTYAVIDRWDDIEKETIVELEQSAEAIWLPSKSMV